MGQDEHENRRKKWDFNEFSFWAHEPLWNGKETFQAFESINSDIRDRILAQITILGLDEHETDAKNRTLTNSASELTNPLEIVKKTISGFWIDQFWFSS